jgi:hypothetical protein
VGLGKALLANAKPSETEKPSLLRIWQTVIIFDETKRNPEKGLVVLFGKITISAFGLQASV